MTTRRFSKRTTAASIAAVVLLGLTLFWVSDAFSAPRGLRPEDDVEHGRFVEPDAAILTDAGANRIASPAWP